MYPLVRELSGYRVLVTVTRRVLQLARQPYYRWLACPVTDADLEAAYRANALFEAHRDDPEFGYRFLTDLPTRPQRQRLAVRWRPGRPASDPRGHPRRGGAPWEKRGKNSKPPGPPGHDDLVNRDFTAAQPNQLWLTDI